MPTTKPPAANGTGEEKRRTNDKSSEGRFQMEVVEDETREEQPLSKGPDANGGKGKSTGNGNGVVNRAFEDEDSNKGNYKGNDAKSMNGGGAGVGEGTTLGTTHHNNHNQQQHHHAALSNTTNGDVEMIPLTTSSVTPTNTPTPPGDRKKATNGQHKNAAASPQQKSSENNLKNASNDLYTDYFMPVNNRRKLLRGQKLYVTRDQRAHKRGWKWIAFWGGVCTFVAAALLTGILAATGIIMSKEEPSFSGAQSLQSNETENTSATWNSTKSDNDTDGQGVILEKDPFFGSSTENTSHTEPNPTTTIPTFTESSPTSTIANTLQGELRLVDLDFTADFTDITSTSSQQLAKRIESELAKTFATMNIMKARVEQFSQGSVIVHFLLTWPDHVYRVTPEQATTYFTDHLSINGDNFGGYRIDPDYFALKELTNRCEENNDGCSENCHWSSSDLRFMCSCSEGHVLDVDGKTCLTSALSHPPTDHHQHITDTFHSTSHLDHTISSEDTTTTATDSTTTTTRPSSGSRGRQLIFGPDQEDITTNDTYTSESSEPNFVSVTTPELIHEVEPEPSETTPAPESPESTPDTQVTHDTHFGFSFDAFNSSTSDTSEGTESNDTVIATTSTHLIHETLSGNDTTHDTNQTFTPEHVQDVTTSTDSTFPFTFTTISSHEMEEVNFTIPALTEDDDHVFFGFNVSQTTNETSSTDTTTSEPHFTDSTTNFTIPIHTNIDNINVSQSHVNVSTEEHFSTLDTDNDNFTMSMMVTKPESEESESSSNHSTTGHGWDRFSHMLTTLNEATASETEEIDTMVTESYHEMNFTSDVTHVTHNDGNLTETPETSFENVTFDLMDMARMFPSNGEEHATTPSTLPEPMSISENHTEPTIELMLNSTTDDDHDDGGGVVNTGVDGVTENITSPWTAVTYSFLYQHPTTIQEANPTTPELLTINSTLELVTGNSSSTSQTLTLSHTTGENATVTDEDSMNAADESTQSSSTYTETVTSLSTNSTDYLTGFSNHETSDSMNLTTVAVEPVSDTE